MATKEVTFLLVEDDDIDIKSLKRVLKKTHILNPIRIARDGIEALNILRGINGQERIQKPYLILLDLNMPRMNGVEFLQAIREDQELKSSIVFVLTTSAADQDIISAYDHNIAGYIVKGNAAESFSSVINMLDCYWRVVEFPMD